MKSVNVIIIATILLISSELNAGNSIQFCSKSQPQLISVKAAQSFGYFRVHRMGRDASLNWSVTDPAVSYFVIERSWDGSFFETIAEVNGNGEAAYKFRDESCFPGYIYYRITAHNLDGSVTTSSVEVLHMVAKR